MNEIAIWYESEKQLKDIIYIDFAYKGLCNHLHIKQIFRRESPDTFHLLDRVNELWRNMWARHGFSKKLRKNVASFEEILIPKVRIFAAI